MIQQLNENAVTYFAKGYYSQKRALYSLVPNPRSLLFYLLIAIIFAVAGVGGTAIKLGLLALVFTTAARFFFTWLGIVALGEWEVAVAKDLLIFRHHRPLLRDRVLEIDPEAVINFFIEPDQLVGPNALVVELTNKTYYLLYGCKQSDILLVASHLDANKKGTPAESAQRNH